VPHSIPIRGLLCGEAHILPAVPDEEFRFAALRIVRAKQFCSGSAWREDIRGGAVGC
jgi:hypothetical protein